MFLVHDNLNFDNINKLNSSLNLKLLEHVPQRVQANVAIAAAITSYARIHMMTIKALPNIEIFYTDTDSFFIMEIYRNTCYLILILACLKTS